MPCVSGSQWKMGSEEKSDQKEFKDEVRQSITLNHQTPGNQITDRDYNSHDYQWSKPHCMSHHLPY